jgi:hypothetical protein
MSEKDLDLGKLRAKAEGAIESARQDGVVTMWVDAGEMHQLTDAEREYVASFPPYVAVRLIAEVERLRETILSSKRLLAKLHEPCSCRQLWRDLHPELFTEGDDVDSD